MQSEDLEPNCFNFQDLFEEFVSLPTKTFYCEICQFDFFLCIKAHENQMRNSRDKFEKKLKEYPNGKSR